MFYEFSQNNSGGWFEENDKLCARLFIEADSKREAISKAEDLGCYWNGVSQGIDCSCCGDRWSKPYNETEFPIEIEASDYTSMENWNKKYRKYEVIEEPTKKNGFVFMYFEGKIRLGNIEEYAQFLTTEYGGWTTPDVRVFYKDGTVKEFCR